MPLLQPGTLSQALINRGKPGTAPTITTVMPLGLLLSLTRSVTVTTPPVPPETTSGQASGLLLALTQTGI